MLRLALVALFATSACRYSLEDEGGGDSDDEPPGPGERLCAVIDSGPCREADNHSDLRWIEQNIFRTNCGTTSCHAPILPAPGGRIVLDSNSHDKLVMVDSALVGNGYKLVVPGDVKKSYLMVLLRNIRLDEADPAPAPAPPSDPGYMPVNSQPICCQKSDAIARWITEGALNN